MKILVTGGAGFIGSNFILYWLKNYPEDSIVNVDALTYAGNLENLVSIQHHPKYTFVHANICDKKAMQNVCKSVDTIIHFAAESHVDRSILDPSTFIKTNVMGTQVLLDVAVESKVTRFHHVSTDEVFGSLDLNGSNLFSESTQYDPKSPYSASKAGSDHLVRAYHHTYGLPVTISNCSNNYGKYQFPEKFIPLIITNILEGKKIPVYGDGLNIRDWLYVEDHCRAIDFIMHKGVIGETYCVGGMTKSVSNIDVVHKIINILGVSSDMIEFVKDRPGHDRRYAIDWSKIKRDLSWAPLHDFDEYLLQTVEWYKTNVSWWKKIKSGEYINFYKKLYGEHV